MFDDNEKLNRELAFLLLGMAIFLAVVCTVVMFLNKTVVFVAYGERNFRFAPHPQSGILPLCGTVLLGVAFFVFKRELKHHKGWLIILSLAAQVLFIVAAVTMEDHNNSAFIGAVLLGTAEMIPLLFIFLTTLVSLGPIKEGLANAAEEARKKQGKETGVMAYTYVPKPKAPPVSDLYDPIRYVAISLVCLAIVFSLAAILLMHNDGIQKSTFLQKIYYVSTTDILPMIAMGCLMFTAAFVLGMKAERYFSAIGCVLMMISQVLLGVSVLPIKSDTAKIGYGFCVAAMIVLFLAFLLVVLYHSLGKEASAPTKENVTQPKEEPPYLPEGAGKLADAPKLLRQAKRLLDRFVFSYAEYREEKAKIFLKCGVKTEIEDEEGKTAFGDGGKN